MELNIAAPTYQHPSQDIGNQKLINYFLTQAPQATESDPKYALLPTAGKRLLIDLSGNEVRAIININDTVYAVVDSSVYKITIPDAGSASSSLLGTITTSTSGRIAWAANSTQVMLVDGTATGGYIITQSTDTFEQITDTDFTGATSVRFMDGYFIYSTPDAETIFATASNNGLSVSALDVVSVEGHPDNVVGLAVDKRELWVFGKETVEIFYNAANATGFPFSRRNGAYVDVGCAAVDSILNIDNTIMWLDNRGFIVRANGYLPEAVSSPAVAAAIRGYSVVSDAKAFAQVDRGSYFYVITFPTVKKTWAYDITNGQWHERAYWSQNDEFEHDLVNCQVRYKQLDLVGLRNSGKVCVWDKDSFTDGGDPIHRLITTAHFQQDLAHLSIACLELQVETGRAEPTDDECYTILRYSIDKGYHWSSELWRSMGLVGEFAKPITWHRLGSARTWIFEWRIVCPQKHSVVRANVDVFGGK